MSEIYGDVLTSEARLREAYWLLSAEGYDCKRMDRGTARDFQEDFSFWQDPMKLRRNRESALDSRSLHIIDKKWDNVTVFTIYTLIRRATMNIGIIGGAGRVGASAGFHLLCEGLVRRLVLVDILGDAVKGEREDMLQCTSVTGQCEIVAGSDPSAVKGCDLVIIPAGSRRKPDQSRLELIKVNVGILDAAVDAVKEVAPNCIILTVVNPVDVLNLRAYKKSGFPASKVLSLGNVVDTIRFRSYLAERFGWNPRDVNAFLCGEHGDSMVPIWSQASYAGVRFDAIEGVGKEALEEVYQKNRKAGAEMIRLKGGAAWAVAVAIAEVVRAIKNDEKRVLPLSVVPAGAYGITEETSISLPVIVGKDGVEGFLDVHFSPDELEGLRKSARIVADTYREIGTEGQ